MLTVYRSNRAEWLARILSEQLRLDPPTPFEKVEVIVNTWPTSRWLGEQLATTNGISALIRFPFPGTRLRQLVRLVLGLEEEEEDSWKANKLVWQILDVFPEFLETDTATPLREWLNQRSFNPGGLNIEEWKLASIIADAFDEYALYRIDEIAQWINPIEQSSSSFKRTTTQTSWQQLLMSLLARRINQEPFGLQVKHAIKRLKCSIPPAKKLPSQLHIFGVSSLAPVQVELIQALSGVMDIKIFLLTPCRDLWQRCNLRRERLGEEWITPLDGHWLLQAPRLEASLGRMGAEFQQLLEGSGESQLGEWKDGDLFAAPANIAKEFKKEPTLLEQLQQKLVESDTPRELKRRQDDTSLLFVACPGERRQVQIIRDQILQWIAADPSLEPRDIIIMTPQIKRYAPLIASVFHDKAATNIELPFKVTDRSQQDNPGITQYIFQLLQCANSRLTSTTMDSLLTSPVILQQQGLSQEDVINIANHLQLTGFRWGLDAEERGGDEVHSLSWCLDRWLLGLALPPTPGLAPGGVAPYSNGITLNELKKWWNVLFVLCSQLKKLRHPHTCRQWVKILKSIIDDLFGNGGPWNLERKHFISILEDWRHIAEDCQLKIEASVVADILSKTLAKEAGRFGHRSGLITVSALEPMRAIPHRVIILMGLDSDIFPHHIVRPGFHLLGHKRKLGDPSSSDQDRYILLEALMSTRQHLMLTWNSRNERTGEHIPAASPVQQWLGQLENELNKDHFLGLVREPHPNPLALNNFLPLENGNPISCDRRNLEARIWLNKGLELPSLALALPLTWTPPEIISNISISNQLLRSWLIAPQRIWLESLQLQPKEWINPLQDLEELDLNEIKRYRLLKNRFENLIDLLPRSQNNSLEIQKELSWEYLYAGQGELPPAAAASLECELLESRWQHLQLVLKKLGPLKKQLVQLNNGSEELLLAGEFIVIVEMGKLKSKNVVEGWLSHLQVCASREVPTSTVVIARNSTNSKKNQFKVELQWDPLPSSEAKEELRKLKSIASQGLQYCWPIPPESGWALVKGSCKSQEKGVKAFKQKWEGGFNIQGERETAEMQLCFGVKYQAKSLISNTKFKEAYSSLYNPLVKNLTFL